MQVPTIYGDKIDDIIAVVNNINETPHNSKYREEAISLLVVSAMLRFCEFGNRIIIISNNKDTLINNICPILADIGDNYKLLLSMHMIYCESGVEIEILTPYTIFHNGLPAIDHDFVFFDLPDATPEEMIEDIIHECLINTADTYTPREAFIGISDATLEKYVYD